jgi:2'-5' RNA ligase
MEQIRAFIAIELPAEVRSVLAQLQARLKTGNHSSVKWAEPAGIHLTLKFLGNIAAAKTDAVTRAMTEAAQGIAPFHLEVKELGVFPNLRRVRVVWVGLDGELARLGELQRNLEARLVPIGFARESRPFTPHLTLARLREQAPPAEQQSFGQLIADTDLATACSFDVEAVSLMQSQLTREGAVYRQISLVVLKKPLSTS